MEISPIFKQENTLLLVKTDDLKKFAEVLAQEILAGQSKPTLQIEDKKPLSQQEAIHFLGKSRQTLIKWRKKGIIVGYRMGGRIYYKSSELISALERVG